MNDETYFEKEMNVLRQRIPEYDKINAFVLNYFGLDDSFYYRPISNMPTVSFHCKNDQTLMLDINLIGNKFFYDQDQKEFKFDYKVQLYKKSLFNKEASFMSNYYKNKKDMISFINDIEFFKDFNIEKRLFDVEFEESDSCVSKLNDSPKSLYMTCSAFFFRKELYNEKYCHSKYFFCSLLFFYLFDIKEIHIDDFYFLSELRHQDAECLFSFEIEHTINSNKYITSLISFDENNRLTEDSKEILQLNYKI